MSDLAICLTYDTFHPTNRPDSLANDAAEWDAANPHAKVPAEYDEMRQIGPVWNNRVTYVARVRETDRDTFLRAQERRLGMPPGALRIKPKSLPF